jgi:hypothetical protein
MDLTEKYQIQRNQFWPEVEHFFGSLPPHLFRQGVLLRTNMAISLSDTGEFKDILCRDRDYPWPHLHFWLLDDWNYPHSVERVALEKHLFLAMIFAYTAVYVQESILDAGSGFDRHFLLLERALSQQSGFHLAQLFPGHSPFWDYHQRFWQEYAEARMSWPQAVSNENSPSDPESAVVDSELRPALRTVAGRLAFTKIPVTAITIKAGQEANLQQISAMMDRLNLVLQTLQEILTLRRDLMRRDYSYPIVRALAATGLDPQQPYVPEQVLGASVLTGSIKMICQESLAGLDTCRDIAGTLCLPTFRAYLANVGDIIGRIEALFSLKREPAQPNRISADQQVLSFTPYVDPLARALEMAESYLLSDLTFRESWDVQRGRQHGLPELVGRVFPSGLIVELLCQHGHEMSQQVGQLYAALHRNGFRYYDEAPLPPDADDLGLLLRLYRFSASEQKAVHRQMLQTPLHWMTESILPSGQIPVWFKPVELEADDRQPSILIWGNSCSTTETNLLLGLAEYNWPDYADIIARSAGSLIERLRLSSLGANLYYVPPYSLWATLKLLALLCLKPVGPPLLDKANRTFDTLLTRFELETEKRTLTPQDAAFLTLTCFIPDSSRRLGSRFDERWITSLIRSQRYDGSWDDEPLFLVPSHRGTAWYASRSVTTAFCYHALKTYHKAG